jgi:hypothetical protein
MSVSKRVRYYFVARGFALMLVPKRVRYYFVARSFALMLHLISPILLAFITRW